MAERPSREGSRREPSTDPEPTADELEQRQRPDGSIEAQEVVDDGSDEPLTPDMIEQRERLDGSLEQPGTVEEESDEPLSPDMIEQRRVVEDDDEFDDREGE